MSQMITRVFSLLMCCEICYAASYMPGPVPVSVNIPLVISECGDPTMQWHGGRQSSLEVSWSDLPGKQQQGQATLWLVRIGAEHDIMTNDGLLGEQADTEVFTGADKDQTVHLVVEADDGTEHYLFLLEADGSGELLWSSASTSARTVCRGAAGDLLP